MSMGLGCHRCCSYFPLMMTSPVDAVEVSTTNDDVIGGCGSFLLPLIHDSISFSIIAIWSFMVVADMFVVVSITVGVVVGMVVIVSIVVVDILGDGMVVV
ncbi:hypothetical protein L1987_58418 [Smallanthus sonchifolius]|uniref:Uncharacterized protein n=1 Tax=Smallanthus sonchifolius TaxID=185202 RepID=A0ACB9DFJ7_9ASTR|nr:hypothetical protein L1987_58418 [Smallanthus sonchifolius]